MSLPCDLFDGLLETPWTFRSHRYCEHVHGLERVEPSRNGICAAYREHISKLAVSQRPLGVLSVPAKQINENVALPLRRRSNQVDRVILRQITAGLVSVQAPCDETVPVMNLNQFQFAKLNADRGNDNATLARH